MKRNRFYGRADHRVLREHELGAKTADLCTKTAKFGVNELP